MNEHAGIKRKELKPCAICGHGVMRAGIPIFYRITVETFFIDLRAVQRQHELEMMIGNPAIAHAMGPDADLAKRLEERVEPAIICQPCMLEIHAGQLIREP